MGWRKIWAVLFSFAGGICFVKYLRLPSDGCIRVAAAAVVWLVMHNWKAGPGRLCYAVFAAALSGSFVLGCQIHPDGDMYTGRMLENYMDLPSWKDLAAWAVMTVILTAFLERAVYFLERKAAAARLRYVYGAGSKKMWIFSSVAVFLAWVPYLLVYYPGFIFGDSLSSIGQALGQIPLNNHHPVFYTLFLKLCLLAGRAVKDLTFGCAVYTMIQMLYLALCIGYQISWLGQKGVPVWGCAMVTGFYGCVPFFAQNSIAMWKDPIFSATLMVWTILLCDVVLSGGRMAQERKFFYTGHVLCLAVLCLSRNNGFYIGLLLEGVLLAYWLCSRKQQAAAVWKKMLVRTGCVLLAAGILTGPVYQKLGIVSEPVESLGIFLNQMARVAAYDGDMDEEDRAYMDSLLPLENYADAYRPCVVDLLKWDQAFSQEFLNSHLSGFRKTYLSLLVKNPYCYVQAWALNTYGYWALNHWELNRDENNIRKGNLDDINRWENYGITPHSLLNSEFFDWKDVFKVTDCVPAIPILTWLVFFLALLSVQKRKPAFLLMLAPSLGLIFTLFAATPYAYWQRYGLALYDLIPVYLICICYLLGEPCQKGRFQGREAKDGTLCCIDTLL